VSVGAMAWYDARNWSTAASCRALPIKPTAAI
jgi:hypothetical protein